jgi:hypothetical protein
MTKNLPANHAANLAAKHAGNLAGFRGGTCPLTTALSTQASRSRCRRRRRFRSRRSMESRADYLSYKRAFGNRNGAGCARTRGER